MNKELIHKEIDKKIELVREYIDQKQIAGIRFSRRNNFAWITAGGDNHVVNSTEEGFSSILITPRGSYFLADNIESGRTIDEELSGYPWEVLTFYWFNESEKTDIINEISGGGEVCSDSPIGKEQYLPQDFDEIRLSLQETEITRYRDIAKQASECMLNTCNEILPGMTEFEIAAVMANNEIRYGFEPSARLVGSDERIMKYRHPIPTNKKVTESVLLVLLGQKKGLYVNFSRIVSFGPPSDDLRKIHDAVCQVDATLILETKPGVKYRDIFGKGAAKYEELGFPEEWKKFTQGGPIGYKPRYFVVTPDTEQKAVRNQLIAWNPTITGTKSEDTCLITSSSCEVLTAVEGWPMKEVKYQEKSINRPDILVRT